jgi:hypothetical protein
MKKISESEMNELMKDAGCARCDPAVCVQCDKGVIRAVAEDDEKKEKSFEKCESN